MLTIVKRWTKRRALGYKKFLNGPASLLLSKTGPPFSPYLQNLVSDQKGVSVALWPKIVAEIQQKLFLFWQKGHNLVLSVFLQRGTFSEALFWLLAERRNFSFSRPLTKFLLSAYFHITMSEERQRSRG